ncbi:MAG: biotin/lipoyl-binding protein [Rhizomicrobium sp.]
MFKRLMNAIDSFYERVMPGFWLGMKPRYQWAFGILALAVIWIGSSIFIHPRTEISTESADAKPTSAATPLVRVAALTATDRAATVTVRGRTQALHAVDVRAEVEGTVKAIHFDKGQKVKTGDVLCEIDINDRGRQGSADAGDGRADQQRTRRGERIVRSGISLKDPTCAVAGGL